MIGSHAFVMRTKNILRSTAVGLERMPKVRVTESGEIGEPPDAAIRYLPVTMTVPPTLQSARLRVQLGLGCVGETVWV